MAVANTKIVNRSWGILEVMKSSDPSQFSYGSSFYYEEFQAMSSRFGAFMLTSALMFFGILMAIKPLRLVIKRFALQPGEGPSEDAMENGRFTTTVIAQDIEGKVKTQAVMKCTKDPGYKGTAIIIVEACLAVLQDYDKLSPLAKEAGPLTPAVALGDVLSERLERTGEFKISVGRYGDGQTGKKAHL